MRVGKGLNSEIDQVRAGQGRAGENRMGPPALFTTERYRKSKHQKVSHTIILAQNITLHMTVHALSGVRTKWVWHSGWRIDKGWYVISVRTGGAYGDWHEEGVVRSEGHCPGGPREVILEHPGVIGREGSGREEE
jgi:hypothetical protein